MNFLPAHLLLVKRFAEHLHIGLFLLNELLLRVAPYFSNGVCVCVCVCVCVLQKVTGPLTTNRTFDILELHPHRTYQFDVRARFELGYLSELPDVNATVLMPEAGTV